MWLIWIIIAGAIVYFLLNRNSALLVGLVPAVVGACIDVLEKSGLERMG